MAQKQITQNSTTKDKPDNMAHNLPFLVCCMGNVHLDSCFMSQCFMPLNVSFCRIVCTLEGSNTIENGKVRVILNNSASGEYFDVFSFRVIFRI